MDIPVFEQIGDAVRSALAGELGEVHTKAHGFGLKVWFGGEQPTRDHYEAQLMRRAHVDGKQGLALEIGFHAEHPKEADNEAVVTRIVAARSKWVRKLGKEAEVGPFLGRDSWRRVSEVWLEPDLSEPDAVLDVADRLCAYIECLEPIRRGSDPGSAARLQR